MDINDQEFALLTTHTGAPLTFQEKENALAIIFIYQTRPFFPSFFYFPIFFKTANNNYVLTSKSYTE